MAEPNGDSGRQLEDRLRTSMAVMAPPATPHGVIEAVHRRVARRRRRTREVIGAGLVALVAAGTAVELTLSSGPHLAASPPARVRAVPSMTTTGGASLAKRPAAGTSYGQIDRPVAPSPCTSQAEPTMASGRFCGPVPGPGSGLGADGQCTGQETAAPCGPHVVVGRFYAYTVPGSCSGLLTFDGRLWVSELSPPSPVPDFYVWIQLGVDGSVRWISPNGSVSLRPYSGQALSACRSG